MSFGWTGPTMRAHVANKEGATVKPTVKVKERGRFQQTWRSSSLEEWEEKWLNVPLGWGQRRDQVLISQLIKTSFG